MPSQATPRLVAFWRNKLIFKFFAFLDLTKANQCFKQSFIYKERIEIAIIVRNRKATRHHKTPQDCPMTCHIQMLRRCIAKRKKRLKGVVENALSLDRCQAELVSEGNSDGCLTSFVSHPPKTLMIMNISILTKKKANNKTIVLSSISQHLCGKP
jgi:hypothetical protein